MAGTMKRGPQGQTRERIYLYVRKCLLEGIPPTIREVQVAFGFKAVQTAREHLEGLVHEKRLLKEPGKSRCYRLPGRRPGRPTVLSIPVLGRVQAGELSMAVEDLEGYIHVESKSPINELFGLRVQGESMKGAGILPGDIVIVRRQPAANSGEHVVALIGDEATVKTLKIKNARIELHPENPEYQPIIPNPDECRILGKVVEIRRRLEDY